MDVLKFSTVEFEKLFLNINTSSTNLNGGAAWNLSDSLYMGTEILWRLFQGQNSNRTDINTVQKEGTGLEAGTVGQTDKTIKNIKGSTLYSNDNRISVLTGIGDIGIKFSYTQVGGFTNNNGNDGDISYYSSSPDGSQRTVNRITKKNQNTSYKPSVEAGIPLGNITLKAGLGSNIFISKDNTNTKSFLWYNNEMGDLITETNVGFNNTHIILLPSFMISVFDFTVDYSGNYFLRGKTSTDLFGNKIKTMDYSVIADDVRKATNLNGTVSTTKVKDIEYYDKNVDNSQDIKVTYKKTLDLNDQLNVGLKSDVNTNISYTALSNINQHKTKHETFDYTNSIPSQTSGVYIKERKTTEDVPSTELTKEFNINVTPSVSLGAHYAINDAVHFNLGFNVTGNVFSFNNKTVTVSTNNAVSKKTVETTYNDVSKQTTVEYVNVTSDTKDEYSETTNTFNFISTSVSCGFTFDLTQNMKLDTAFTWVGTTNLNNINARVAATVKL